MLEAQKDFFQNFSGLIVTMWDHLIWPYPALKSNFDSLNIFHFYTSGAVSQILKPMLNELT